MNTKLIKTESENQAALARIEALFDAQLGTPEGDELELLITLVELYELQTYPMDMPSPVDGTVYLKRDNAAKA
jgi:HTH-type transcriptional regulator / antitoxin HigA